VKRSNLRRSVGAWVAIAIAVGLTTGALAYWAGPGSGSASTVLADTQPLTFAPGTASNQLFPGDDTSVSIIAINPNSFFVHIGSIALDSDDPNAIEADAAHSGCNLSSLHFVTQNNAANGWAVPPRAGTTDGTLTIEMAEALTMSSEAASACQGAVFTVHVEALS
jgi:hypothetical protein